jgi:hypothetical protein
MAHRVNCLADCWLWAVAAPEDIAEEYYGDDAK